MARAASTSDLFNAVAEPCRREIVGLLALRADCDVAGLVFQLGIAQPAVSKHLKVLRQVGLVAVRKAGRRRVYRLNPRELKPVFDWIHDFERLWAEQLAGIREAAERKVERFAAKNRAASNHQPISMEKPNGRPRN